MTQAGVRVFRLVTALAASVCFAQMRNPVVLAGDGWFRQDGALWVPLGGFHGNVLPLSRLGLSAEEARRLQPHIWNEQKTEGQGHIDLLDVPADVLRRWFRRLEEDGVTAIRLFPRARVSADVLDLCGKINPELQAALERAFEAARPYHIRFLLQLMPEPTLTGYLNTAALESFVLPRYTPQDVPTAAQRRFISEKRKVSLAEWFTDPDVLSCQKLYLSRALEWVAREPQIFALEIYNEQGWSTTARRSGKSFEELEDAEIRWSKEIVRSIKDRLPGMAVCLSHPGYGVTYYDPLKWSKGAGVDFYSSHLYAGHVGDSAEIDLAAVTGATGLIVGTTLVSFPGEWGIFDSPVPEALRRYSHRDAIWLSLMSRQPGFFQWTYEFPEEYRWARKILAELPPGFSAAAPSVAVEIGPEYRRFHTNSRYPRYPSDKEFRRRKQSDENLRRIYRAYRRSLDLGVPIRFAIDEAGALSLAEFERWKPRLGRSIRAEGGYQLAWLKDAGSNTWLAYLRSRKIEGFRDHFVGLPQGAPLRIKLDLPKGRYRVRLIDIGSGRVVERTTGARATIKVASRTSADYVLVIEEKRSAAVQPRAGVPSARRARWTR